MFPSRLVKHHFTYYQPRLCPLVRRLGQGGTSQRAQDPFFGSLDVAGMDIDRCPVINDVIFFWCYGDHSDLRMFAEQLVANRRSSARLVQTDNDKIWTRLVNGCENLRLVGEFAHNLYIWLVGERGKNQLAQQSRTVRHKDPYHFFHGTLRVVRVSMHQQIAVRIKKHPRSLTSAS